MSRPTTPEDIAYLRSKGMAVTPDNIDLLKSMESGKDAGTPAISTTGTPTAVGDFNLGIPGMGVFTRALDTVDSVASSLTGRTVKHAGLPTLLQGVGVDAPGELHTQINLPADQRSGITGAIADLIPQKYEVDKLHQPTAESSLSYLGRLLSSPTEALAGAIDTVESAAKDKHGADPELSDVVHRALTNIATGRGLADSLHQVGADVDATNPQAGRLLTDAITGGGAEVYNYLAPHLGAKPVSAADALQAGGLVGDLIAPAPTELLGVSGKAAHEHLLSKLDSASPTIESKIPELATVIDSARTRRNLIKAAADATTDIADRGYWFKPTPITTEQAESLVGRAIRQEYDDQVASIPEKFAYAVKHGSVDEAFTELGHHLVDRDVVNPDSHWPRPVVSVYPEIVDTFIDEAIKNYQVEGGPNKLYTSKVRAALLDALEHPVSPGKQAAARAQGTPLSPYFNIMDAFGGTAKSEASGPVSNSVVSSPASATAFAEGLLKQMGSVLENGLTIEAEQAGKTLSVKFPMLPNRENVIAKSYFRLAQDAASLRALKKLEDTGITAAIDRISHIGKPKILESTIGSSDTDLSWQQMVQQAAKETLDSGKPDYGYGDLLDKLVKNSLVEHLLTTANGPAIKRTEAIKWVDQAIATGGVPSWVVDNVKRSLISDGYLAAQLRQVMKQSDTEKTLLALRDNLSNRDWTSRLATAIENSEIASDWGKLPSKAKAMKADSLSERLITFIESRASENRYQAAGLMRHLYDVLGMDAPGRADRFFKSSQLSGLVLPNTRYMLQNLITQPLMVYSTLGGKALGAFKEWPAAALVLAHIRGHEQLVNWLDWAKPLFTVHGQQYTNQRIAKLVVDNGLRGGQGGYELSHDALEFMKSFLQEQTWPKWFLNQLAVGHRMGAWAQLANDTDSAGRVSVLIDSLKNGDSEEVALRKAKAAMFDYNSITGVERQTIGRLFYFYSFQRHAAVEFVKNMMSPNGTTRVKNALLAVKKNPGQSTITGFISPSGTTSEDNTQGRPLLGQLLGDSDYLMYGPGIPEAESMAKIATLAGIAALAFSGRTNDSLGEAGNFIGENNVNPLQQIAVGFITAGSSGGPWDLRSMRNASNHPDEKVITLYKHLPSPVWDYIRSHWHLSQPAHAEPAKSDRYEFNDIQGKVNYFYSQKLAVETMLGLARLRDYGNLDSKSMNWPEKVLTMTGLTTPMKTQSMQENVYQYEQEQKRALAPLK